MNRSAITHYQPVLAGWQVCAVTCRNHTGMFGIRILHRKCCRIPCRQLRERDTGGQAFRSQQRMQGELQRARIRTDAANRILHLDDMLLRHKHCLDGVMQLCIDHQWHA